jgi:hypothetical protein
MTSSAESQDGWTRVGSVAVDSGTCLVVDPTYHRDSLYGVEQIAEAVVACVGSSRKAATLAASDGQPIGTVVQTGYGDDEYPVEARYVTDQRGATRIAEIRIRFITDL